MMVVLVVVVVVVVWAWAPLPGGESGKKSERCERRGNGEEGGKKVGGRKYKLLVLPLGPEPNYTFFFFPTGRPCGWSKAYRPKGGGMKTWAAEDKFTEGGTDRSMKKRFLKTFGTTRNVISSQLQNPNELQKVLSERTLQRDYYYTWAASIETVSGGTMWSSRHVSSG